MCSLINETIKVCVCVYSLCFTTVACDFASYFSVDFNLFQFPFP